MPHPVMLGAEPWSHAPDSSGPHRGALLLHGFTGSPSSMRGIAEQLAAADFHVELPCLPGHGTVVDDMVHTTWNDWTGETARAHARLAARADRIVVVGQSMGGALALWTALQGPEPAGVVCINPVVVPQPADVIEMLGELLDDGMEVMPGVGPDIADPDGTDVSYEGTPVRPLISLLTDGLAPLTGRFHELTVPLRLFTSRQDHVVEPANSEHLAATYGGEVDHTWLELSFHVATQDHDRDLIGAETLAFATRMVTA